MEGLIFRYATQSDYDSVIALLRQLNPDDPIIDKTIGMGIFSSILASSDLKIYLAELDGRVVSTCYLNVIPNLTRGGQPYALIENVVTDQACRRQGAGATLLKQAIADAFEQGCYKVMLLTGRDERVHTFYEHCGMEKNKKTAFIKRQ